MTITQEQIKKMEEELAQLKKSEVKFRDFTPENSRKKLLAKSFDGFSASVKIRKKGKKTSTRKPLHSDYFGACCPEKNRRALPVPNGCLQATLVLLADQYNWTSKRCNLFAKQLGKSETVSMARNKFNKYDDTGKLWGKQKQKAVEYLNINYTVLNTIIPTI